jgi:hypothetical protein
MVLRKLMYEEKVMRPTPDKFNQNIQANRPRRGFLISRQTPNRNCVEGTRTVTLLALFSIAAINI